MFGSSLGNTIIAASTIHMASQSNKDRKEREEDRERERLEEAFLNNDNSSSFGASFNKDISELDLSKVKDMSEMFVNAKKLENPISEDVWHQPENPPVYKEHRFLPEVNEARTLSHETYEALLTSYLEKKALIPIDLIKNISNLSDVTKSLDSFEKLDLSKIAIIKKTESAEILNELKLKALDYNIILATDMYNANQTKYEKAISGKTESATKQLTDMFSELNQKLADISKESETMKLSLIETINRTVEKKDSFDSFSDMN